METITTYCGRPITELSREELIEALEVAAKEIANARNNHQKTLDMWSLCNKARTG